MPDSDQIVRDFLQAWNGRDVDAIMHFFSDDESYRNMPMGPAHEGKMAIRRFIDGFIGAATHIDFQLQHQLADDQRVMNERLDILHIGGAEIALPVMGIFLLHDGKICAWRDYFDMAAFLAA